MSCELLPMQIGQKVASGDLSPNWDSLLGAVFRSDDKEYRLVEAGGTLSSVGGYIVEYASRSAHTVQLTTATNDVVVGVFDIDQVDLVAGDYCLVQVSGRCEVIAGEAITAGHFCTASTDGKADSGGATTTTEDTGKDFAIAVDAASNDGDQITADIIGRLG